METEGATTVELVPQITQFIVSLMGAIGSLIFIIAVPVVITLIILGIIKKEHRKKFFAAAGCGCALPIGIIVISLVAYTIVNIVANT